MVRFGFAPENRNQPTTLASLELGKLPEGRNLISTLRQEDANKLKYKLLIAWKLPRLPLLDESTPERGENTPADPFKVCPDSFIA
ncbi:hypothetical protein AVEN_26998-1 [Araneus ventricosus]|uniref:Uncharacterized protein n=1 Tax=Araneus ventricosus TaxID=182803 RepID=A0A4Y2RAB5_ARAVE|nr:hypothetical protein AVEN_26998-1 [Araneus ventricosus]